MSKNKDEYSESHKALIFIALLAFYLLFWVFTWYCGYRAGVKNTIYRIEASNEFVPIT